jgi:hypothetical protein
MKWLTLEEIKQQCRIEQTFTDEDAILTRYGNSAENTVLNLCDRTYDDFIREYGEIPADIVEATLMLVTLSYEHRSPVTQYQMYAVGYAFDMKVKPYMRLTSGRGEQGCYRPTVLGSDVKIVFTVDLPDNLKLADVDFTVTVFNESKKDTKKVFQKTDCYAIGDGTEYCLMFNSDELGIGRYMMKVAVMVPDNDFAGGFSKEIVNINPNIVVKG